MLNSGLYIVATPIGCLKDISAHALEILQQADVIACEDTRVSKKLFSLLALPTQKRFISYEDHSEQDKAGFIAELVAQGQSVALISDAGSPLISDPGYKLVRLCREKGLCVHAIPGASAVITALQLSGLPTNRFMFAGFIPNKDKARYDLFRELKNINSTLVFYETAKRLVKTLEAMADIFENREVSVIREMTKVFEESRNGTAADLIVDFTNNPPKGEIVIVVAPPSDSADDSIDMKEELSKRLSTMSLKSAVKQVTELSGRPKNEVYALALEIQNEI